MISLALSSQYTTAAHLSLAQRHQAVGRADASPASKSAHKFRLIQWPPTKESTKEEESSQPLSVVLRNQAPQWHEHLQCWCLNFHRRLIIAYAKNFQLVAAPDPCQVSGVGDDETMLLQFGKVGDDMFTMDYRQPLLAFQAFAICLTSLVQSLHVHRNA